MISGPPGGGGSAVISGTFQGAAAARPAPATVPGGAVYWATDTGEISINNLGQTAWQLLARTSAANFLVTGGGGSQINLGIADGGIDVLTIGQGLRVAEGTNAKQGTAVLVAGAVTVANTSVTANSRINCTGNVAGGTAGASNVSTRTAGTSFTITSTNAADTSTVAYQMFEPG